MKLFNLKINIGLLIGLCRLELSGASYITIWREWFWTSISQYNVHQFIILIIYFSAVALALCVISGLQGFLISKIALEYRRRLTRKFLRCKESISHIEGYQQRIQEDCREYPLLLLNLLKNIGTNGVMIIFYIGLIIYQVGFWFIFIPIGYAVIGTLISGKIAYPLIKLNYLNQVTETAFRLGLRKLQYSAAHRNNHLLYKKTKHLSYFQVLFGQISVIFPYLILAPLYFTKTIIFGTLMQVASAISNLTDALSVVLYNFSEINKLLSCRKRLNELHILVDKK